MKSKTVVVCLTAHLWQASDSIFSVSSYWILLSATRTFHVPSLLKAEETQSLLTHRALPNHLGGPPLDSLLCINLSLGSPKLDHWIQHSKRCLTSTMELKNHFPRPAAYTLANTAQDAVCLFTARAHRRLTFSFLPTSNPQSFSAKLLPSQSAQPHFTPALGFCICLC